MKVARSAGTMRTPAELAFGGPAKTVGVISKLWKRHNHMDFPHRPQVSQPFSPTVYPAGRRGTIAHGSQTRRLRKVRNCHGVPWTGSGPRNAPWLPVLPSPRGYRHSIATEQPVHRCVAPRPTHSCAATTRASRLAGSVLAVTDPNERHTYAGNTSRIRESNNERCPQLSEGTSPSSTDNHRKPDGAACHPNSRRNSWRSIPCSARSLPSQGRVAVNRT